MDNFTTPYARLQDELDSEEGTGVSGPHSYGHSFAGSNPSVPDIPRRAYSSSPPNQSQSTLTKSASGRWLARSKKSRKTNWLVINETGDKRVIYADKRSVVQITGIEIPMRVMRLLDPTLPTVEGTAQVIVRDNAMVFCIEHVRLIITADQVVLPVETDKPEQLDQFIKALEAALKERNTLLSKATQQSDSTPTCAQSCQDILAFELQVLDVALDEICQMLSKEVEELDKLTHPALEDLTRRADAGNLERVRKIKTHHQRLLARLAAVRELLERYLADDQDMWRMCLTKKRELDVEGNGQDVFMAQRAMNVRARPMSASVHSSSLFPQSSFVPNSRYMPGSKQSFNPASPWMGQPLQQSFQPHWQPPPPQQPGQQQMPQQQAPSPSHPVSALTDTLNHHQGVVQQPTYSDSADYHDLLNVENLLESYLTTVDTVHKQLKRLGRLVDDTEDFINIELAYSRNKLIQVEILVTAGSFSLAFYGVVAGVLGENLVLPDPIQEDVFGFIFINVGTGCFCLLVFFSIFAFMRRSKLI